MSPQPLTRVTFQVEDGPHPRLLVCHDLQGGYGQDSLLEGGTDPNQFALYSWHLIDVFAYFAHSLVTIPPPSWTDAAHLHGTQVRSNGWDNPIPNFLICYWKEILAGK